MKYEEWRSRLDKLITELQELRSTVEASIELLPDPSGLRVVAEITMRDPHWCAAYPKRPPLCVLLYEGRPPKGKKLTKDDLLAERKIEDLTPDQAFGLWEIMTSIQRWVDGNDMAPPNPMFGK